MRIRWYLYESISKEVTVRHFLPRPHNIVGRGEGCDVQVHHPTVSRRHVDLIAERDCVKVRDLGSRNGTFIDGTRIHLAEVSRDAPLRLGSAMFRLQREELVEATSKTACAADAVSGKRAFPKLTERQRELAAYLASGMSESEIAAKLGIALGFVRRSRNAVFHRLGVSGQEEFLARFGKK